MCSFLYLLHTLNWFGDSGGGYLINTLKATTALGDPTLSSSQVGSTSQGQEGPAFKKRDLWRRGYLRERS